MRHSAMRLIQAHIVRFVAQGFRRKSHVDFSYSLQALLGESANISVIGPSPNFHLIAVVKEGVYLYMYPQHETYPAMVEQLIEGGFNDKQSETLISLFARFFAEQKEYFDRKFAEQNAHTEKLRKEDREDRARIRAEDLADRERVRAEDLADRQRIRAEDLADRERIRAEDREERARSESRLEASLSNLHSEIAQMRRWVFATLTTVTLSLLGTLFVLAVNSTLPGS